jgi:hypothetical protein
MWAAPRNGALSMAKIMAAAMVALGVVVIDANAPC